MMRRGSKRFLLDWCPCPADHLGRRRILRAASEASNRLDIEAKPFMKGDPMGSVALEKGFC